MIKFTIRQMLHFWLYSVLFNSGEYKRAYHFDKCADLSSIYFIMSSIYLRRKPEIRTIHSDNVDNSRNKKDYTAW